MYLHLQKQYNHKKRII